ARPARPAPEDLPEPTKYQRHAQLDALLDLSTAAPETLPRPKGLSPRDHGVFAPGVLMDDAGTGKAAHDALPALLRALKRGDARTRARAADDMGHLGAKAAPALPALMAALGDLSPRVRASAGLALGNIGTAHPGVVPLLTKALKDRSEDVGYAAALALSRIDTAEARDAFGRHVGKEARRAIDGSGSGRIRP
ncbi:MAG: HEAT repeat domain-containing protein, partial [Elusimicrobiota bacterium]|nr:HEAT repeat domain-containing protein [Elusimicrobiota bacterium]